MKKKLNSYSKMLDIKEDNPDYKLCPANIIGRDSLDAFYSFIIDKGSSDGKLCRRLYSQRQGDILGRLDDT